jgi:hypothetical protein
MTVKALLDGMKPNSLLSKEPVIAHLLFNLTSKVEVENGGVTHNFESGTLKDHFNSNF